ncbi:Uncharacterized conserved protein YdhG, YjbR/CyaY-like superfamily, DUF1801 family [Paenibacillus catalpae]|uniref:Uncharacterized conserved protein YdhG, YjbR/CyaY-like superfamily, DUF1801 family n=1 Tax=Paenibacillus catalpae TaxID=1045775 RepID=A0A1I2CVB0_9BACL|nr:DUF1801 domain-containing protein [Paenibacillus catalpae]SFE72267.1 Uncharacterized conserved protein YdhG, YjbR/CyaY-like superfamily, DUF1801 family [Paenibacillus catalpae]
MEANKTGYTSIDEYIADFSPEIQAILTKIREVIRAAAPDAKEKISYQMPAFELNGNLVYYAAFKKHIGFYPTAGGISAFQEELSGYKGAKGSVQFPLNKPIPYELIKRITEYRAAENREKGKK